MSILEILFRIMLLFCLAAIPILGLGIGLGYGLHAVIPGLDLNWALVAGAVFSVGIVDMMMRFIAIVREAMHPPQEENNDEEEDEEKADEPWVVIPRKTVPPQGSGRKRRKRR